MKFCDGYNKDGEIGPFVLERIRVETVKEEEDIVLTLEGPPVAAIVMFLDMTNNTTQTAATNDDYLEGVFVHIAVVYIIRMKNNTLKNELYLRKQKSSGNKDVIIARLTTAISEKKQKFTDKQIRVAKGKKKAPEIDPNNGLKSFPASVYWQELKPNKKRVVKPLNPSFDNPRAPTVADKNTE